MLKVDILETLKLFKSYRQSIEIVKVKINITSKFFIKQRSHLIQSIIVTAFECNFSHQSKSLLNERTDSKVNEDILFKIWTIHDILWFDIVMDELNGMHDGKMRQKFLFALFADVSYWVAILHEKLYTVAVTYEVES